MGPYCRYCDNRCFVPADYMRVPPPEHMDSFKRHGFPILATCPAGMQKDKEVLGFNVQDLVPLGAGSLTEEK